MSLLRDAVSRVPLTSTLHSTYISRASRVAFRQLLLSPQTRSYASKKDNKKDNKKDKKRGGDRGNNDVESAPKESRRTIDTNSLVPGSQRILAGDEYFKAEEKMKSILDRFKKDVAELETRASGRVTPVVLAPVRVVLPHSEGRGVRLEDVATVGVREGTTLIVTVFEESSLKPVEQAIYDAKLPSIIPQRLDNQTIKIPMPKPTVEARQTLFVAAQRKAEDGRTQIRKQNQLSVKKGAYAKHSQELDEFKELNDRFIGEIDKVLASFKKIASPSK